MSDMKITRRRLLTGATAAVGGVAAFHGPWKHNRAYAQASDKPVKIGITSDASGQYANSGASDRRGMMLAIDEANANGGVLGRKIEFIHLDTETTAATGSRVAERMITREDCGFLIGAVSSGVANAISQVAQRYGVIYLNTNSSSPTESGQNCHRVKFVWDGNGTNFAKAAVKNSIDAYGKKWLLLTNDYGWGHDTAAATKKLLDEYDGEVVEEILVPQGTRDFSAALLKIQQANPDVVAAAVGGDDQVAMRQQVAQLGQTIGHVAALIAEPLTRYDNLAASSNATPILLHKPLADRFGQAGRSGHAPPQHRLGVHLVDVLPARAGAAYEREPQLRGGNLDAGTDD